MLPTPPNGGKRAPRETQNDFKIDQKIEREPMLWPIWPAHGHCALQRKVLKISDLFLKELNKKKALTRRCAFHRFPPNEPLRTKNNNIKIQNVVIRSATLNWKQNTLTCMENRFNLDPQRPQKPPI